jgi:hypothetical protein
VFEYMFALLMPLNWLLPYQFLILIRKKFDTRLVRRIIEKVFLLSFLYFMGEVEVELARR